MGKKKNKIRNVIIEEDPIEMMIRRLEGELGKPDIKKRENKLRKEFNALVKRSGLTDDEVFKKYILPSLRSATESMRIVIQKNRALRSTHSRS